MRMLAAVLAFCLVAPVVAAQPAESDGRRGHGGRRGLISPPEIERRIVPRVQGAQYLGFEFDPDSAIYTLKFLRDGNMIWVEVDARSGQVVGRSGR